MFKKLFPLILTGLLACQSQKDNSNQTVQQTIDTNKVIQQEQSSTNLQQAPTIIDLLNAGENFSMFTSYLNSEVSKMLTEGEYTVLAPNNKAISSLGEAKMSKFVAQGARFVRGHLLKGKYDVSKLKQISEVTTLEGKKLKVSVEGEKILIGGAQVIAADILAKNGVIHAIDRVIE